jgi:long-chain acyl-CoA synthetase
MSELQELSARALAREPAQPAIEFDTQWITWGDLRRVADRLGALLDASGIGANVPVAFVPRYRPSAIAALPGLIAKGRCIRMLLCVPGSDGAGTRCHRPAGVAAAIRRVSDQRLERVRG